MDLTHFPEAEKLLSSAEVLTKLAVESIIKSSEAGCSNYIRELEDANERLRNENKELRIGLLEAQSKLARPKNGRGKRINQYVDNDGIGDAMVKQITAVEDARIMHELGSRWSGKHDPTTQALIDAAGSKSKRRSK